MREVNHVFRAVAVAFCLTLLSCEVCRECECQKNGQTFMEEECARGIGQSDGLDYWERDMIEEKDYESCRCTESGFLN